MTTYNVAKDVHAARHAAGGADPVTPAGIGAQPVDSDLTTIAALDATQAGVLASDGAGWLRKTYAAVKTAMSFTKADVGLGNVDNTSDANKPVSTAQAAAIAAETARAQAAEAAITAGLSFKAAAVVSTANVASRSGLPTTDGVTLTDGQVILLVGQSSGSQNGLWVVHSGAWTRPGNYATGSDATATSVFVEAGTTNGLSTWVVTGTSSNVVDTNVVTFQQASGLGEITVTSDLVKAGNQLGVAASIARILTPTAVKTGAYTAAAGDLVLADTTSAAFTVTLPTTPADKTQIAVKVVGGTVVSGLLANTLTVAAGGSDHFNTTTGSTSLTVTSLRGAFLLQYVAATGVWVPFPYLDPAQEIARANAVYLPPTYTLAGRPTATGSKVIIWVSDRNGGQLQQDTAAATWTDLAPGMSQAATPALIGSAAITGNVSTTSTTDVDATGLSVTFTAVAGATYEVKARLSGVGNTASGASGTASLTTGANAQLDTNAYLTRSANDSLPMFLYALVTPGAGSVTYKIRLHGSASTAFILGAATAPSTIAVMRVA